MPYFYLTKAVNFCFISFIPLMVLPIIKIVIGSLYINSCPLNPKIPIYLIIGGICNFLHCLTYFVSVLNVFSIVTSIFLLVWCGLGSFWIFTLFKPDFALCNEMMYMFAFWFTILEDIGLISMVLYMIYESIVVCVKRIVMTQLRRSSAATVS